jgi:hypothetical protein
MSRRTLLLRCVAGSFLFAAAAQPAFAHGDVMRIGSSQQGAGQLIIESGFQFELDVHLMPSATVGDRTLYTSIFPSFSWILEAQNGTQFPLRDGVTVTVTIADPIAQEASMRVSGRLLDSPNESATLGTVSRDPEDHVHPEWQLILTNGVVGDYAISFLLSTTAPGYTASPVYQLQLTNAEAEATPTPTGTPTATPTLPDAPTDTATPTGTPSELPSPSPTPAATACAGDCDGDATVTIDELVLTTGLALRAAAGGAGKGSVAGCSAADQDESGTITVDELIAAVGSALNSCDND